MSVAYDADSSTGFGFGGTFSWTHTPAGTPAGAIAWGFSTTGTDIVTGVTYGGSAMGEVTGSPNLKNSGETMSLYGYFLGASVPTGAQSVEITIGGSHLRSGMAMTVTAAADTEVVDTDATINSDSDDDPTCTLSLAGRESLAVIGFASGHNAATSTTESSGWTSQFEGSNGAVVIGVYTYDTVGTSDVTAGWTQTAEDALAIALAIAEAGGEAPAAPARRLLLLGVGG